MTVSTIKASGGNFTSLSAWEASLPATATTPLEAECYNFALADNVAFAGTATSSSNYIRVYTPSTERHDGRARAVSGTGFRISDSTGAGTLRIADNHVRVEGLEVEQTGANSAFFMTNALASGSDIRIDQCLIHDTQTGTNYTIIATASNLNLTIRNSAAYGNQRSWDTRGATSVLSENNTFWRHAAQLGLVSGTELSCKNTYSGHAGAASDDFWSGGSPSGNNNASSDTSAITRFPTGSVNSVAGSSVFTSVTAGAEDFSLKTGTNALVDAGTTLTSTVDLIGTTRPQGSAYDIGAVERSAGGSPSPITGTFAAALAGAVMAVSGALTYSGTLATSTANAAMSSTGGIGYSASVSASTAAAAMTASGGIGYAASLGASTGDAGMTASGAQTFAGTLGTSTAPAAMIMAGSVIQNITGTISATTDNAVMNLSGPNLTPQADNLMLSRHRTLRR